MGGAGGGGVELGVELADAGVGAGAAAALVVAAEAVAAFVAVDEGVHCEVGDVAAAMEAQNAEAEAVVC